MTTKHFFNDPTHLVNTALQSLTITNPAVALDSENKIIYTRPSQSNDAPSTVSVISGGGSGHEPSFGAFVGQGLLSAAVAGTIFASPSTDQVRAAIEDRVDTSKGVLVTVMNYTGDILNFGVAVEKAKAANPALKVEMLVVGDDVGVPRSRAGKVGRRGIAGTVLVHKITGALAAQGASLEDVAKVGRLVTQNLVSVGASLEHVHVPGRAVSADDDSLPPGEVELGMGIHNEPGSGRVKAELPQLVKEMLTQLLDKTDNERSFVEVNSNEVVLMINNLGGLSVLELGGITKEVVSQLGEGYIIRPVRIYAGTFMTSLNGLGFSISLLNVVNTDIGGPNMVQLLDAPSETAGWSAFVKKETWEAKNNNTRETTTRKTIDVKPSGLKCDLALLEKSLTAGLEAVIAAEPEVTNYDTVVGDGDCGTTLKRGAEGILSLLSSSSSLSSDIVVLMSKITSSIESSMDGTSGALYSIFFNSLVQSLRAQSETTDTVNVGVWIYALEHASKALARYTPAKVGDRTLVDALQPFIETLHSTGDVLKAAKASEDGATKTKGMTASLGRTVYVGGEGFKEVPDPGAWGLSKFFLGLAGEEPQVEVAAEEPKPEDAAEEPKPEVATEEPTTEVAAEEPKPEVATKEPITEVAAKEPKHEVAAEEPKPEVATEVPTTEVAAGEPKPEVAAEEPKTDIAAQEPETEVVREVPEEVSASAEGLEVVHKEHAEEDKTEDDFEMVGGMSSVSSSALL